MLWSKFTSLLELVDGGVAAGWERKRQRQRSLRTPFLSLSLSPARICLPDMSTCLWMKKIIDIFWSQKLKLWG